jgi:hypothetical protein
MAEEIALRKKKKTDEEYAEANKKTKDNINNS